MKDRNVEYITKFKEMSKQLIEYGWFPVPYMSGAEFDALYRFCQSIAGNPPKDNQAKESVKLKINRILTDVVFHPNYRSFYVVRAKEVPHVSKFSHFLERGILHYYKQDFLSCTLCLLPAVEGVLLSHFGWQFGSGRKPSQAKLIDFVRNNRPETDFPERYEMYAETLANFLEKWILQDTSSVDFETTYLNRHYILHGMGNEHFYSVEDCHRLILFFDLYIELLSIENKKYYVFIPTDNLAINIRREYYLSLIENNPGHKDMIRIEKVLLQENDKFIEEKNSPEWTN
ncbi:MAG: hypothetical protein PWQ70_3281, partial [Clostridiales bacterium]|nr:hypothetical protein [Clostridiales bacterium]